MFWDLADDGDRVSRYGKAITRARLSLRFHFQLLNRLTCNLVYFVCVHVMTIARLGLKVKVNVKGSNTQNRHLIWGVNRRF